MGHLEKPSFYGDFPLEPAQIDRLRGHFNHHVIGPLSHTVAVRTLDGIREKFLLSLNQNKANIYRDARTSAFETPVSLALLHKINRGILNMGHDYIASVSPVSDILTPEQQQAASRLNFNIYDLQGFDSSLFQEITTISDNIRILIGPRHPELRLHNIKELITYLRNPTTHNRFRDIAQGGNAFVDSLHPLRRNNHPAGKPWRDDPTMPILTPDGRRTTPVLRSATTVSKQINESLPEDNISTLNNYGLRNPSKRYSSGCPVRHRLFRTNVPELTVLETPEMPTHSLSLTKQQVERLMSFTNPPVMKALGNDDNSYYVTRDAYAAVCNILADGLEILTSPS